MALCVDLGAGLTGRLGTGVAGWHGLCVGVFGSEIQIPSTTTPLSKALAPKGMSSLCSIGYTSACSSRSFASVAACLLIIQRFQLRTQKAQNSVRACKGCQLVSLSRYHGVTYDQHGQYLSTITVSRGSRNHKTCPRVPTALSFSHSSQSTQNAIVVGYSDVFVLYPQEGHPSESVFIGA